MVTVTKSRVKYQHFPDIPYELICGSQVLALKDGDHTNNLGLFQQFHHKGNAVVVWGNRSRINKTLWCPDSFSKQFGWWYINVTVETNSFTSAVTDA